MAQWQGKSRRKKTGGRLHYSRGKRKYEIGREKVDTVLGETKVKTIRTRGGNKKHRLLRGNYANVYDPAKKVSKKVEIKDIVENRANIHYVRRQVITCGCVIDTEIGHARVTSRPGQEGNVNAVLIQ